MLYRVYGHPFLNHELQAIRDHLGPDAPHQSIKIVPEFNKDGVIRFVTPTDRLAEVRIDLVDESTRAKLERRWPGRCGVAP
jgi:hypothetical protein